MSLYEHKSKGATNIAVHTSVWHLSVGFIFQPWGLVPTFRKSEKKEKELNLVENNNFKNQ